VAEVPDDIHAAREQIQSLCDDGRPAEALAYAQGLTGHRFNTDQLLAIAEIDAGELLSDRDLVARGVSRLEALEEDLGRPAFAYNRANGLLVMWEIAVSQFGIGRALAAYRVDLQQARDLYDAVGGDPDADLETRCQALVNLGNSMDGAGRHIDAIHSYNAALELDPEFAMAHGNRGLTYLHRAGMDETHRHALACEAVASLDFALAKPDDVLARGGPSALESFRSRRDLIKGTPTHTHTQDPLADPYLQWCLGHELFLHSSHPCITPSTKVLDSLSLSGMVVGVDDESQQRLRTLQDAINALLRDYIAVRYLAWTCLEPASPARQHAAKLSTHASFYDTLTYGRWGVATGLSVATLAAATNLLDKVASVAHLYLGTGRNPAHVYFRGFYLKPAKRKQPAQPDPAIASELDQHNLGLLALCDLAGELERPTDLNELLARRHAATHRAVVAHDMLLDEIDDDGWLDRIEARDLRMAVMEQLVRARAALLYVADMINGRERRQEPEGPIITMPSWPAQPEDPENL
jgi:hypothetical protein